MKNIPTCLFKEEEIKRNQKRKREKEKRPLIQWYVWDSHISLDNVGNGVDNDLFKVMWEVIICQRL